MWIEAMFRDLKSRKWGQYFINFIARITISMAMNKLIALPT